MILLPPATISSSPSEVLNPSASPDVAASTVSKVITLGNPPETSQVPAQEISSPGKASIQTTGDQANGVAATQMTKQTEELVATPVSLQEATADPTGDPAGLPVPRASVPSAEASVASPEEPQAEEAAPTKEGESKEPVVAAEESASQKVTSVEAVAEKLPDDPKPSAPKDVSVKTEDVKAADSPKAAVEASPDAAQDVNITVVTQNENPHKEEPVALLSKGIQSKGISKCEGPPLSTRHLSGWFILRETWVRHTFCPNLFDQVVPRSPSGISLYQKVRQGGFYFCIDIFC